MVGIWLLTGFLAIIAASAMAIFLLGVERTGYASSKDFWVFGKLFYEGRSKARILELSVHFAAGIFFAFVYLAIWAVFEPPPAFLPALGLLTGIMHGIGVAMSQIIMLQSAKNGVRIALTHAASHAVFGLVFGIGVGILDYTQETFVDNYAKTMPMFIAKQH
jgi:hypothetical protein